MCEKVENLFREREKQTILNSLFRYVEKGGMTISFASKEAGMTESEFSNQMRINGFVVPQASVIAPAAINL